MLYEVMRYVVHRTVLENDAVEFDGDRRTQRPGETVADVMGSLDDGTVGLLVAAHVTGGTRRCRRIVFSKNPAALFMDVHAARNNFV